MRVVLISDTHEHHREIKMPDGDILIHAGDFTYTGEKPAVEDFNAWLGKLPYRHKVVIAGNHELTFWRHPELYEPLLTNCVYLKDSGIEIESVKIWGSPWTPEFGNWAFMKKRGPELYEHWQQIPAGLDLLVSHGPPYGVGDKIPPFVEIGAGWGKVSAPRSSQNVGDTDLRKAIEEKKPLYHICGHIHYSYGNYFLNEHTRVVNASICDESYAPTNKPVVIDL